MAGERRCGRCRTVLIPPQPWATTDEPQVAAALPLGDEHRSDEACTGWRPRRTPYPSGGTARREYANSLRAAIRLRYICLVEPNVHNQPGDHHDPLRCVQGVACFELGVRANAQVQLQGNQIGAAAKPPQSADPLSAATICRVAWSNSREAVVPRE